MELSPPARWTRKRIAVVTASVVALGLAVTGGAVALGSSIARDRIVGPGPSRSTTVAAPPLVLATVEDDVPVPTQVGIRTAINALVAKAPLGRRVGVSVRDVDSGAVLYQHEADLAITPASTTKLITAATVLATRGPSYRIATRAVAGARPGDVVLVGGGDATLAVGATRVYPEAARLDRLAAQVKSALGSQPVRRVVVDSSLFTGPRAGAGWDSDIIASNLSAPITALMTDGARVDARPGASAQRYRSPDVAAGEAFAALLGLSASAVVTGTAPEPAAASSSSGSATADGTAAPAPRGSAATGPTAGGPQPGAELARVESPPLQRVVDMMLADSDNVLADTLARQVALAKGKPASFAGAAEAMGEVLTGLGLPAAQARLSDGSGLSRLNRITPQLLTELMVVSASTEHPALAGLFDGLPVAGWSGTLQERFQLPVAGKAGQGLVRGKTGTLAHTNAMSGVVLTAGGRVLAFAVLADQVPVDRSVAEPAIDGIAAALARCGCT